MKKLNSIIFIFACVLITACKADSQLNNLKFDSTNWKSGNSRARGNMAHDLQRSSILANKTKVEVVELLGEPDNQKDSKIWLYKVNFGDTFTLPLSSQINLNVFFDDQTDQVTGTIFTGGQLLGIF